MRRLLVATDFSRRADFAANWAVRHAKTTGRSVVLYHAIAVEGPGHPSLEVHRNSINEWLETQSKQAETVTAAALRKAVPGVEILCEVEVANERAQGIRDAARRHNVDAIVVGSRGENAMSRAVLGSVAAALLTEAPCEVVVVPKHARHRGIDQVVLLSDLADLDADLAALGRFAGEPRPGLRIAHLRNSGSPRPDGDASARARAGGWPGATYGELVSDDWLDAVDEVVADVGADMVAMAVRPHGLLHRIFNRDLVHAVAFQSLVPVVALRV